MYANKSLIQLEYERIELESDIDGIIDQLKESSEASKCSGKVSDPGWLHRARASLRHKRKELNLLRVAIKFRNVEIEKKKKELDAIRKQKHAEKSLAFERVFIQVVKEKYGKDAFDYIVQKTNFILSVVKN